MSTESDFSRDRYAAFMGLAPEQLPHWEHWSCPDAETYLSGGIDAYDHPKLCREKIAELYPQLRLGVPKSDKPKLRPEEQEDKGRGRWGGNMRDNWQQLDAGARFKSDDEILAFSPLEHADAGPSDILDGDYSSEDAIYERNRKNYPAEWGDTAPEGNPVSTSFYKSMFMWPLMTFGYEKFLSLCLLPEFDRIMDEFAEINRRVFRALARLPVNFMISHDDIVLTNGPVCPPEWMNRFIFPRYEEFWGMLKASGIEVIFMVDGCVDAYVEDVFACGARGIISEPYTDYRKIAQGHKDCFIAGEGDNRVLMREDPAEIDAMVKSMVETSKMSGGYMMCVGNHIPWNVPPESIKRYLDRSAEWAHR
jgi:hypothetical protein